MGEGNYEEKDARTGAKSSSVEILVNKLNAGNVKGDGL